MRGSMMSRTTRVERLLAEPSQRLFSIARLDDLVAVALERIGEQGLDGLLVVDQEDGGGVGHGVMFAYAAASPALVGYERLTRRGSARGCMIPWRRLSTG